LQIGERDEKGNPYLDAQHPHNSPLMGLTISDTIGLSSGSSNQKDNLKIFFAPRGQATDGPIAFMHRPSGTTNPDAPLGHHVGQDIGHISSTVIGGSLALGSNRYELSVFNGTEPEPAKVDLHMGVPNSAAIRYGHEFSASVLALASIAYIKKPEEHEPEVNHRWRYSLSANSEHLIFGDWNFYNTVLTGAITDYDRAKVLFSFGEEFWLRNIPYNIWARGEVLQRTPAQLQIDAPADTRGRWVGAATLGYTHTVAQFTDAELGVGLSGTKTFLPDEFDAAYGGDPISGKIFVQLTGMKMWAWNNQ
jgi:hypothetical protein